MKEVEEEKEVKEGAVARLRRWPGAGEAFGAGCARLPAARAASRVFPRQAKIADLGPPAVVEEHVCRLDVLSRAARGRGVSIQTTTTET